MSRNQKAPLVLFVVVAVVCTVLLVDAMRVSAADRSREAATRHAPSSAPGGGRMLLEPFGPTTTHEVGTAQDPAGAGPRTPHPASPAATGLLDADPLPEQQPEEQPGGDLAGPPPPGPEVPSADVPGALTGRVLQPVLHPVLQPTLPTLPVLPAALPAVPDLALLPGLSPLLVPERSRGCVEDGEAGGPATTAAAESVLGDGCELGQH